MKLYSVVPRVLQTFAWVPTYIMFVTRASFSIIGARNLHGYSKVIFACNHVSEWDPIVLTAAALRLGYTPMFYVAAPDKEFNDDLFGWRKHIYKSWFFRSWGSYPIVRGEKDYAKALAAHVRIISDGFSICIFPEGAVNRDGKLKEAKGGVVYLMHATQVPIIPTYIHGTYRSPFSAVISGKRNISVTFAAPILPSELEDLHSVSPDEYKRVASMVTSSLQALKSSVTT